jgi:fructose-specific phosphotransferase system component IIB
MILTCRLQTGALAGTAWLNFTADDFASLGPVPGPAAGWRLRSLAVLGVATQAVSLSFGERTGSTDAGTRGFVQLPAHELLPQLAGTTLTLGNLTVTFQATTQASSGFTVQTGGKSLAAVVAEVAALITAGNTGIAGMAAAAGEEPGSIILQANASTSAVTWTKGSKAAGLRLYAAGLAAASYIPIAVGATLARREFMDGEAVHAIAIRPNTANADVLLEAEIEAAGWPQR